MQEIRFIEDYRMIEKIAKGTQGSIWVVIKEDQSSSTQPNHFELESTKGKKKCELNRPNSSENESNTETLILKRINNKRKDYLKLFTREKTLKNKLKHKYLVEIVDIIDKKTKKDHHSYIFYKHYPIDLLKYLKDSPNNRIPEKTVKRWVKQITKAMIYLNSQDLMHRDLKPDNILLTSNSEDAKVKICDFGLIREVGATVQGGNPVEEKLSHVGTLEYAAPEVRKLKKYSFNCDVWSLGVITHVLIYGKYPKFTKKELSFPQFTDQQDFQVSSKAESFIRTCLNINPKERQEFYQIINHPFLKKNEEHTSKKIKIFENDQIKDCSDFELDSEVVLREELGYIH